MEEQIYKWIYNWVAENFGQSEVDDPSWDIHALAEELDKHRYDIYRGVEREFLEDDCDMIAKRHGYKLTKKERDRCVDAYMDSEQYCDVNEGVWADIMSYVKGEE